MQNKKKYCCIKTNTEKKINTFCISLILLKLYKYIIAHLCKKNYNILICNYESAMVLQDISFIIFFIPNDSENISLLHFFLHSL